MSTGVPFGAISFRSACRSNRATVVPEIRLPPICQTRPERRWCRYVAIAISEAIDVFDKRFCSMVIMNSLENRSCSVQVLIVVDFFKVVPVNWLTLGAATKDG